MSAGSAISLFSGAGGLDLGVEAAGFAVLAAIEWDDAAADTMEKNAPTYFPSLRKVVRGDLFPLANGQSSGLLTKDIPRAAGLRGREQPDLLIGGPSLRRLLQVRLLAGLEARRHRSGSEPAAGLHPCAVRGPAPPLHL